MKDEHTYGKKMARNGRTKVIYKGTFVSIQSLGDDIQKKFLNKIRLKFERFHNHEYTDMLKFEELYERMWHFTELDQISNDGYEDSDSDYGGYNYDSDYSD